MCDAAANGRRPRRSSAATGGPPAQRHCERSDAIQSRRSLSCHRPRKRTIQYSRDAGDDIDRPRRTGSPAFAEDDSGGRGGATGLEPWPGKPATATTALGPKISKTTPCTVARKAHWRSLACAIPPRHLTRRANHVYYSIIQKSVRTQTSLGSSVGATEHTILPPQHRRSFRTPLSPGQITLIRRRNSS